MKINYHLLTIFWVQPSSKTKQQKQPPHNNRPKWLLLKASSYLGMGQYLVLFFHQLNCLGNLQVPVITQSIFWLLTWIGAKMGVVIFNSGILIFFWALHDVQNDPAIVDYLFEEDFLVFNFLKRIINKGYTWIAIHQDFYLPWGIMYVIL